MEDKNKNSEEISQSRKNLYYIGMGTSILGGLLFLSNFISFAMNFGNFNNFESRAGSGMIRAVLGMILLVAGQYMMSVGRLGAAGSGVILDPKRAREDVKPWSKMTGGVINDALSEVDIAEKLGTNQGTKEVIKVRCRHCSVLNDEDARFCKGCGREL